MSQQTRQYGGTTDTTSFTLTTSDVSGTDYTSEMVINTTGSNVSGAFISSAFTTLRPIRFTNLTMYFSNEFSGSVDLQISTSITGSGGYQSGALTANGVESVTPNYAAFTSSDLWYGFQKNSSSTVRAYRSGSGGGVYSDGDFLLDGFLRADVTWQTAPNAPTSFTSTSKTTTSVALSWIKPTDMGGPTSLTGYRILYKEASSSTWLSSDKFGSNTTTTGTISGLTPNTEYNFRVAATNSVTDAHNATYTSVASHTGANSSELTVTTDPSPPSAPTISFSRSGLVFSYSGSSTLAAGNGTISSYEVSQRVSSDGGTTFGAWSVLTTLSGTTYSSSFTGSPATSYQLRVRAESSLDVFGEYTTSSILHAPNVPLIPINPIVLTKNVKKVNIDWDAFRTNANAITEYNGAVISGYEVESQYSTDGVTFTDYANITTTGSGTTVFLTNDLLVAKTYRFRVRANSDVGLSAYHTSPTIFVSAYGSRATGPSSFVPIENAKIFLGIGQPGADGSGWKIIENVKRFDGSAWTDLQT
jgi:uncharacterized protein YegP (UPF0339 family)